MSSFNSYMSFHVHSGNTQQKENKKTLGIIKECFVSRDHDVGCECFNCRKCREELIDYYKKKKEKKKKKLFISSQSLSSPIPIPIDKRNLEAQESNYLLPNSLPTYLHTHNRSIVTEECINCNTKQNLSLINDFYFICNECEL